jgi:hypothetical protein
MLVGPDHTAFRKSGIVGGQAGFTYLDMSRFALRTAVPRFRMRASRRHVSRLMTYSPGLLLSRSRVWGVCASSGLPYFLPSFSNTEDVVNDEC